AGSCAEQWQTEPSAGSLTTAPRGSIRDRVAVSVSLPTARSGSFLCSELSHMGKSKCPCLDDYCDRKHTSHACTWFNSWGRHGLNVRQQLLPETPEALYQTATSLRRRSLA